ncbi:MAG: hypothetical protein SGJ11_13030 [Phycisphaerae bacterium]|nr:hypothetical protein [Phycisphaerae bacterium]
MRLQQRWLDGDDVFLVGEVNAGFNEREIVRDAVSERPHPPRKPAVSELPRRPQMRVVGCSDRRGDAFGLRQINAAAHKRSQRILSRRRGTTGKTQSFRRGEERRLNGGDDVSIAGADEFHRVFAGVAVRSGCDERYACQRAVVRPQPCHLNAALQRHVAHRADDGAARRAAHAHNRPHCLARRRAACDDRTRAVHSRYSRSLNVRRFCCCCCFIFARSIIS